MLDRARRAPSDLKLEIMITDYEILFKHNKPLQKRERTGKEYECFPFV